jgi:hypothetical protein
MLYACIDSHHHRHEGLRLLIAARHACKGRGTYVEFFLYGKKMLIAFCVHMHVCASGCDAVSEADDVSSYVTHVSLLGMSLGVFIVTGCQTETCLELGAVGRTS